MSYCTSCGKQIEEGNTSCPICGHPVSLDLRSNTNPDVSSDSSEARDVVTDQRVAVKRGLSWRPIFLGAFAILVIGFVCVAATAIFSAMSSSSSYDTTFTLIDVGIVLICFLLGGLIVGFRVRCRGALHGMLSALIAGIIIVIYTLIGMLRTEVSVGWIIVALTVELLILPGFGTLGGFLGERLRNRKSHLIRH